MTRVLIIGFGKVGSHLQSTLRKMKNMILLPVIKNSRSSINRESLIKSDIIFICTQDDKINSAVAAIIKSGANLKGKIAAHTSGALTSDELWMLKKRGCSIASFHPVQTFNQKAVSPEGKSAGRKKEQINLFSNIFVAIEGDTRALKILRGIAVKAGSVPVSINKDFKTFHHICCVISSGFVVANLSFIRDIYTQKNGFKKVNFFNIYKPLAINTLSNIASEGIEKSLTGPIVRNDIKTIVNHIKELKKLGSSEVIEYYKLMSLRATKIAKKNRKLSKQQSLKLEKLLNSI